MTRLTLLLGITLYYPQSLHAEEQKPVVPDSLTAMQIRQVDSIEKNIAVQECCESDLASCLKKKPACTIAQRFHGLIRWLEAKHTGPQTIADEVHKRYDCLSSTQKCTIDTSVFPVAGDPAAPLLIAAYVTATCPLCHYITRELYTAVSPGGPLFHKARLTAKPLGTTPGNRTLCAANRLGRFWDFLVALSNVKERADSAVVYRVADSIGIRQKVLSQLAVDRKTMAMAEASTAEAGANGVTVAPTIFFNRVRYTSYKDPRWLIDAAEYLYESKTGILRTEKK